MSKTKKELVKENASLKKEVNRLIELCVKQKLELARLKVKEQLSWNKKQEAANVKDREGQKETRLKRFPIVYPKSSLQKLIKQSEKPFPVFQRAK